VESMKIIGKRLRDLLRSDDRKINAALFALNMDCMKDENKRKDLVSAGGCLALVLLLEKCLDKAIDGAPACAKVSDLNELAGLATLHNSLGVITNMMSKDDESIFGFTVVGGVEAVVKVAKTFPNCQALQETACEALLNFTNRNISGNQNIIESGGIKVLLAAVINHVGSSSICIHACGTLSNIIEKDNKEDIRLLISLGGATAIAKVREEWQDDDTVQAWVKLTMLIGTEMTGWADMQVDTPVTTAKVPAAIAASATNKDEDSIDSIGQMIEDLFGSDNAKINAALDALNLDLKEDKKKCYKIQAVVGGCFAFVLLLKKCLAKATDERLVWDQVTEVNELAELTTIYKTLHIMIRLTHHLAESKIGISAIGGAKAVVKAMKTFPKCQALQEFACILVLNLACSTVGKKTIVEAGGMDYLLVAINNHLNSVLVCKYACIALSNIIEKDNKEDIRLLISLGGATAVANIREECPDGDAAQAWVKLAKLIGIEMTSWADKE
jgi:D-arabinose 5-phosphate isomerase GutQ